MKKVLAVMLISLIAIMGFVSCTNEASDLSATKSLVFSVDNGSNTRALNRTPESLKAETLYWKYEAKKADNTNFITGQTNAPKAVKEGVAGLHHEVGPFSQGLWNFTLYGYTDSSYKNLAWKGSVEGYKLVVGSASSNVVVDVHRLKTAGVNGIISIADDLQVKIAGKFQTPAGCKQEVKIAKVATPDVYLDVTGVPADGYTNFTVESGAYIVYVSKVSEDGSIVYALNQIAVNVYDNLKTIVEGKLDERVGNTIFGTNEVGEVTAQSPDVEIKTEGVTDIVIESNIVETQTPEATATKISIPQGALAEGTKSANVTMVPVAADKAHANDSFTVEADKVVVGALDLKLTTTDASGKTSNVTDFNSQEITITTIIGKGLTTAPETALTAEQDRKVKVAYSGEGAQPKTISYDPITGELVFTTTHFSEFYVTYAYEATKEAMNLSTGVTYDTFDQAIEAVSEGDTIVLLKDVSVDQNTRYSKAVNMNLDGRGHKLTVKKNEVKPSDPNAPWWLFSSYTGSIRNLDYVTLGYKMLVEDGHNLVFENVNAYGDMVGDSNIAPFLCYPMSGNFRFTNCINYVNIIDAKGGDTRGAAFIGYYPLSASSKFIFENCENYGHLRFAKGAAMFFGNATKTYHNNYTITNCNNYGTIEAFGSGSGFYGAGGIDWKDKAGKDKYNASKDGITGEIKEWGANPKTFSVSNDGTPAYQIENPDLYSISYKVKYYIEFTNKSGAHPGLTVDVPVELVNGKLPTGFVMTENPDTHNTVIDGILQIDPWVQTFFPKEDHVDAKVNSLEYIIILTEKKSGNVVGQRGCNISK